MMDNIQIETPIKLSDAAISEIKFLRQNELLKGLRIGVEGGGCAGFSYVLKFDIQTEFDNVYNIDDIEIYINKTQEMYLYGTTIDFKQGLDNRGFIYENPNAKNTCGCGTSFSA